METRSRQSPVTQSDRRRWRAVIAAREAEWRGGLETDNQLEFGRLLHADRLTDWSINGWKVPQPDSAISECFSRATFFATVFGGGGTQRIY